MIEHEEIIDKYIAVICSSNTTDIVSFLKKAEGFIDKRHYLNAAQVFEDMLKVYSLKNNWYYEVKDFIAVLKSC